MQVIEGGIEEQTQQALKNLKAVVEASGSEMGKVVKTTVRYNLDNHVFLQNFSYWRFRFGIT